MAGMPGDHMAGGWGPPRGAGCGVVRVRGFVTEAGAALGGARGMPVAFSTFGELAPGGANCVVVGHSLTSNASVAEWWAEMLGPNDAAGGGAGGRDAFSLDTAPGGDFVVCVNYLGSPYGTASPLTPDPAKEGAGLSGPEAAYAGDFPHPVTVRDNVRLQRLVLEALGVRRVRLAIGGSMGGMLALEWAATFPDFVRSMALVCTCGRHTDWAIGLGEAQRHAIYADERWRGGHYSAADPPAQGLATSRMMAMLSYRAPASVDSRFGRSIMGPSAKGREGARTAKRVGSAPSLSPPLPKHARREGEGEERGEGQGQRGGGGGAGTEAPGRSAAGGAAGSAAGSGLAGPGGSAREHECFAVESYLRYQGKKFIRRFDANCYVNLTLSLDTHDVARGRGEYLDVLRSLEHPALVVGVDSDVLYPIFLQKELAASLPGAAPLVEISSPHGHDSFLIEIAQLNRVVRQWRQAQDLGRETGPGGEPLSALALPKDLASCEVSEPMYGEDIDFSEYVTEPAKGHPFSESGAARAAPDAAAAKGRVMGEGSACGGRRPTVLIDSRALPTAEAAASPRCLAAVRAIQDLRTAGWSVFIADAGLSRGEGGRPPPEVLSSRMCDLLAWSSEHLGADFAESNILRAPRGSPVLADIAVTHSAAQGSAKIWPQVRVQIAEPDPGKWLVIAEETRGHSAKPQLPWGVAALVPANPAPSPATKRRQFSPCYGALKTPTQRGAAAF